MRSTVRRFLAPPVIGIVTLTGCGIAPTSNTPKASGSSSSSTTAPATNSPAHIPEIPAGPQSPLIPSGPGFAFQDTRKILTFAGAESYIGIRLVHLPPSATFAKVLTSADLEPQTGQLAQATGPTANARPTANITYFPSAQPLSQTPLQMVSNGAIDIQQFRGVVSLEQWESDARSAMLSDGRMIAVDINGNPGYVQRDSSTEVRLAYTRADSMGVQETVVVLANRSPDDVLALGRSLVEGDIQTDAS